MSDRGDLDPNDEPQLLVGVSFGDPFRAEEFLLVLRRLASAGSVGLTDIVLVVKDEDGRTHVRETTDPQPLPSALSGAMWAGLFGLLVGGPVGWVAGLAVGAGAGAVAAKVIDHGIPDEWVDWFKAAVAPGTTTLAFLATSIDRNAVEDELTRFPGGHLVYANLEPVTVTRWRSALGDTSAEDGASETGAGDASTGAGGEGI